MAVWKIPCAIIRGGTSKGVYIQGKYFPKDRRIRDQVILSIFGSPDSRQIDGLGGADPLTSKLAIINPSHLPDADVDYTFAQVGIDKGFVNYSVNCGNISSGVGPFAIDEGLVEAVEPKTVVRILNTNTKKLIISEVPVKNDKADTEGNLKIDGVPGSGPEINLKFVDPGGAITGKLLPTGNVVDIISLANGRGIEASIVDAGNLYVFLLASDLGLKGAETPKEIEAEKEVMDTIGEVRFKVAEILEGRKLSRMDFQSRYATIPKVAIASEPVNYITINGKRQIEKRAYNLTSRIIISGRVHKAYAITGAICTIVTSFLEGSIVNRVTKTSFKHKSSFRIGHPSGVIKGETEYSIKGNTLTVASVSFKRTARRIMDGYVYVPESRFHLRE